MYNWLLHNHGTDDSCYIENNDDFSDILLVAFQEWEDSNAMAMVIYVVFQVTCVIGTFSVCYVGQLLLDEVNRLLLFVDNKY